MKRAGNLQLFHEIEEYFGKKRRRATCWFSRWDWRFMEKAWPKKKLVCRWEAG